MAEEKPVLSAIVINEAQLVLAEKRTSLAVMRTGIAVLVLPLSVLSFLIATSEYYDVLRVLPFLVPLAIVSFVLIVLGAYLIIRSIIRIQHYDRMIQAIKAQHHALRAFID
jgi:uncharacterized membrane protein YidH (DUF202 family)